MNRKERRAAQKRGGPSISPMAAPLASAFRAHQAGHRADAERLYRDVLAVEPRNAAALHLLGALLHQTGRSEEGISSMRQAIAIEPRNPDYHYNLGTVLNAAGRSADAIEPLSKALALNPRHAEAHFELGNAYARCDQLDAAEKSLRRSIELKPDNPNAVNNLGLVFERMNRLDEAIALWERMVHLRPSPIVYRNIGIARKRQGRLEDAEAALRRALELQPDYPDASHQLGHVLLLQGRSDEAFTHASKALDAGETPERRILFALSLLAVSNFKPDNVLRERLRRALAEAWIAPDLLSRHTAEVLKAHPVFGPAIQRVTEQWASANAARQVPSVSDIEIASAAGEPLLLTYLQAVCNLDAAIERFLTALRANLLERAIAGSIAGDLVALHAALARQCFINDYVFDELESETTRLQQVIAGVARSIASGAQVSPAEILAIASYRPLSTLENAGRLLQQDWPQAVAAVLQQQIKEPLRERSLREAMPALTPIDDATSAQALDQGEQTAYPRWIRTAADLVSFTIDELMLDRLPHGDQPASVPVSAPDILIAGCGTGMNAIIAAQTHLNANILAVDSSVANLGYAQRKAEEAGLSNIAFAQADILNLGSLQKSFDVIEAVGVLNHIDALYRGWSILLSLLRPGGLMKVGLNSEIARRPVAAAKDVARHGGYQADPEGIRRLRQHILRLPPDELAAAVASLPDFYTAPTFRDLVMREGEASTTLPAIRQFLDANNLTFLGFELDNSVRRAFASRFPEPSARKDLAAWQTFEQDNPATFAGMYQFWIQKHA
jgi:tetratricopeptide (TPR) repeat protein/2-polyprenyl-3-methyl-5-hydroxy-6-metoxy-1,4-benzoquinol methylase